MGSSIIHGPAGTRPVPVDSLPLSNRTRSRLREAGIDTVAKLQQMSDRELLGLAGFGHTCLAEVRALLRVAERGGASALSDQHDGSFPGAVSPALLAAPIAHLPITNRARGVFQNNGIVTVRDYLERGPRRLLELKNFGETTFEAVNRAIAAADRALVEGAGDHGGPVFQHPGQIAAPVDPDSELASLPVAALDLPRRARRACQQLGLKTLGDLTAMSAGQLLLRRNFGQSTLRRIQEEMVRFMAQHQAKPAGCFADVLDRLLSRLQDKERQLVELREGRQDGRGLTLTEAGERMTITESRACQIEHAAWAKLRRFGAGVLDEAARQAEEVLARHGGLARPAALEVCAYFSAGRLPLPYAVRMLARLLPHRLARLADGRLVAMPAATLTLLAARLRKRLGRSRASIPLEILAGEVLRGLELGGDRIALIRALCEVLFHREVSGGHGAPEVVRTPSQGLGDDLRAILLNAGKPLHFGEIARRLALPPFLRTDLSDEKVRLRLCRDPRFVLVRRGLYDLRERFHVEKKLGKRLADRAAAILLEAARPTSVALLTAELRSEPGAEELSEFVLGQVLRSDERFRHLGRGTFVLAGSNRTSVRHVSCILEEILEEAGTPLSYAALRERVQARRQVSDGAISATLVGRETFLRIDRGTFDLARRYPFDAARRAALADAAEKKLAEMGGVASLERLLDRLAGHFTDMARRPGPVLVGDLLRREGRLRFLGSGFVAQVDTPLVDTLRRRAIECLKETNEPLRPSTIGRRLSLGAAALALLRVVLKESACFRAHADGRYSLP